MSTTQILSAIDEYIDAKRDGKDTLSARRKFAQTLNDYIDYRIQAATKEDNTLKISSLSDLIVNAPKPPNNDNIDQFIREYLKWFSDRCILLNEKINPEDFEDIG